MKYNILVADDQKDNIIVILEMLKMANDVEYSVMAAPNGQIACELAEKKKPDLIIMDWEMPVMNGIEAVRCLKSNPKTLEIPIIMATALTSSNHLQEALDAGAIDYIKKPIDTLELLARVKSSLLLSNSFQQIKNQKIEIEKNHKLITDSIRYAQRIQGSVLPSQKILKDHFDDAFVLFKPKDYVSGDFYWIKKINDKILVAAVDCTGHGVPGAFMSLIGFNLLEQITNEYIISNAASVLDYMRKLISSKLINENNQLEINDGMDLSICLIDTENSFVHFAGAYNPIYHISKGNLKEIKGDKISIGKTYLNNNKSFTNHTFEYSKGDSIYLFSDGYADQIGGPENEKFYFSTFKEILTAHSQFDMDLQKENLNHTLENWIGEGEQIDDILVIGIRL